MMGTWKSLWNFSINFRWILKYMRLEMRETNRTYHVHTVYMSRLLISNDKMKGKRMRRRKLICLLFLVNSWRSSKKVIVNIVFSLLISSLPHLTNRSLIRPLKGAEKRGKLHKTANFMRIFLLNDVLWWFASI